MGSFDIRFWASGQSFHVHGLLDTSDTIVWALILVFHVQILVGKTDSIFSALGHAFLAVNKVKFNPRSSFEQTFYGQNPPCYIPSPKVIGPLVLETCLIIFKGFYHILV